MTVLVTGGAGYIGAHVVELLIQQGESVVVVDDLSTGSIDRIGSTPFGRVDLAMSESVTTLARIISTHNVDAVIHLAAKKQVAESLARPALYYQQNVGGLANVLLAMQTTSVRNIVFSSSASVYGETDTNLISEDHRTIPVNPYGATKLVGEDLLTAATSATQANAISLRYFNVAGALGPALGDRAALNLVPMVFDKLEAETAPIIFGADYPTPDGTCIRDYIHVADLAEAHLSALDSLRESDTCAHRVFNIGTGSGSSVLEMVNVILEVSGYDYEPIIAPRRAGDPARVVADPARATSELGWKATHNVYDIIESAWASYQLLKSR